VAAGAAQFALVTRAIPGLTLGLDQFAHFALATIWQDVVIGHESLTAGRDSSCGNYPPSILHRQTGRICFFKHQIGLWPIKDGRKQLLIA
jgi:hypothetical protein